ncbi:hypothetical protein IGI37_001653 [Enterococcus sp. AZ194]
MSFLFILITLISLYLLYKYLLYQSKYPSGWIGLALMKIWNKSYLPMTSWALHTANIVSSKKNFRCGSWKWSLNLLFIQSISSD